MREWLTRTKPKRGSGDLGVVSQHAASLMFVTLEEHEQSRWQEKRVLSLIIGLTKLIERSIDIYNSVNLFSRVVCLI